MVLWAGIVLVVGVVLAVMSVVEKGKEVKVKVREGEEIGVGMIMDRIGEVSINKKAIPKAMVILIVFAVISYALASAVIIQAGNRGVIFNMFNGVNHDRILDEGFHIVLKGLNTVTVYDVYTKTWSDKISCLSSDGLPLSCEASIRYRINANKVSHIKQNVGNEWDVNEKILIPTSRSKMRDVAAKFTAQEAYAQKRIEFQQKYQQLLEEYFEKENYLTSEQILVRKIIPPEDLTRKIQETKVAEQEVIKQKNILEAEKMKKKQEIVKAEALAKALEIKGRSIARTPQIIAKEWIDKWDGVLPQFMMGEGSEKIIIDLEGMMKKK